MTRAQDYGAFLDTRPDRWSNPEAYRGWCGYRNGYGQSEQMRAGNVRRMLAISAEPKRIPADLAFLDAAGLEKERADLLDDLGVTELLADLCLFGESAFEVWGAMHRHMECPDEATAGRWSAGLYRLAAIDGALALVNSEGTTR